MKTMSGHCSNRGFEDRLWDLSRVKIAFVSTSSSDQSLISVKGVMRLGEIHGLTRGFILR